MPTHREHDNSGSLGSIGSFLRHHRRPFLMYMSLGLLATWILKDVLVESARDEVAFLSGARTTFYSRSDALRIGDEIAAHLDVKDAAVAPKSPDQLEAAIRKILTEDFRASLIANHLGDVV